MTTRAGRRQKESVMLSSLSNYSDNDCISNTNNEQLTYITNTVHKQLSKQRDNIIELTKSYQFMSDEFEKLKAVISKLTKENKEIRKENKEIRDKLNTVEANAEKMAKRINQLESIATDNKQVNNANHMIITNVPKIGNNEDLKRLVRGIAEQVDVAVQPNDIVSVFQNENKKFKTFPIIVKMKTGDLKKKCMEFRKSNKTIDMKKALPGTIDTGKNINFHHLMEKQLSELLAKVKSLCKKKKFKFAWFDGNNILVRKDENAKTMRISSELDLNNIK